MTQDIITALALMLVLEGILPFITPRGARQTWFALSRMDDRRVRIIGLASMLGGLILLNLIQR